MKFITEKRFYTTALIILAVIAGYSAWRDMQPAAEAPATEAYPTSLMYKADSREDIAELPDNGIGVLVNASVDPARMREKLDGRHISLRMNIEGPQTPPVGVAAAAQGFVDTWKDAGYKISYIFLEYPTDSPDIAWLEKTAEAVRMKFGRGIPLGLVVRRSWYETGQERLNHLANTGKYINRYIFKAEGILRGEEDLAAAIYSIEEFNNPFFLQADALPGGYADFAKRLAHTRNFIGFVIPPDFLERKENIREPEERLEEEKPE